MADSAFGEAGILGCEETEIELESWADFVREFALNSSPNWIFRGHADFDWSLVTSLQRAFAQAGLDDAAQRAAAENSTIGFFQERARLHIDHAPDEQDLLGWLAVMQHYGAPTRLQDWTSLRSSLHTSHSVRRRTQTPVSGRYRRFSVDEHSRQSWSGRRGIT
jgi:FRG domain